MRLRHRKCCSSPRDEQCSAHVARKVRIEDHWWPLRSKHGVLNMNEGHTRKYSVFGKDSLLVHDCTSLVATVLIREVL